MAIQLINVGTIPNDGTGDNLRGGGIKINANLNELYNELQSFSLGFFFRSVATDIEYAPTEQITITGYTSPNVNGLEISVNGGAWEAFSPNYVINANIPFRLKVTSFSSGTDGSLNINCTKVI